MQTIQFSSSWVEMPQVTSIHRSSPHRATQNLLLTPMATMRTVESSKANQIAWHNLWCRSTGKTFSKGENRVR